MKAIVDKVLSFSSDVRTGTSAYLDDILIDESVVSAQAVSTHLAQYGLESKAPEHVREGARVLGLQVWGERNTLQWKRGSENNVPPTQLTRRSVFSYCGELMGHYPVCGWLRVATAFIKREANRVSSRWDEPIHDDRIQEHLDEVAREVSKNDPVRGRWDVSGSAARVWEDASALALGVALEVDNSVIEDGVWLRPNDARHINMAELDAVIKGLNLAIAWRMRTIELMTDSAAVHRWLSDGLSGKARLRTKAANEMLIRRRIETVVALVREYQLTMTVTLVRSMEDKADRLTRVPRRWLVNKEPVQEAAGAVVSDSSFERLIAEVHHAAGHPGVRRTLYFAQRRDPRIAKREVSRVVSNCDVCQSIDPPPTKWKHGRLEVPKVRQRVGVDLTHCGKELYLTLIDCGPSRFCIWRRLSERSSTEIARHLESVFYERGAPEELLTDNDTAFRSNEDARLADPAPTKWKHGRLEVPKVWQRVGVDVTHCGKELYLTLIDCGPSRFCIWRRPSQSSSTEIARHLESVFYERGGPEEMLTDNDTAFRSNEVARLAERWGTRLRFRCAYAASGNGITERCHRTIKVIARRTGCTVQEAVYRYNLMPRDDCSAARAPANAIYRYTVRDREESSIHQTRQSTRCPYAVGDSVWIRPHANRCDTRYDSGFVTRVISDQPVKVDGMPRHVRDIRHRTGTPGQPLRPVFDTSGHGVNELRVTRHEDEPGTFRFSVAAEPQPAEQLVTDNGVSQAGTAPRRSTRRRQQRRCPLSDCSSRGSSPSSRGEMVAGDRDAQESLVTANGTRIITDVPAHGMMEHHEETDLRRSGRIQNRSRINGD
ncbi:hypothetical protein M513_12440 [Trichuris suis]|uniref:Integrase catalytic domain-containing protein n=1 Tax=Trichuris suis TaxID=68888 RepID=A0A085LNX6_9BILA|nr:hypothetical protein M513_12440 [Trichuris suis]